jgi:glutaconate CoA-transferase subunit A
VSEKVMSMKEAISRFVREGDTVFFAGMQHGEPTAAIHEMVRQKIGHLTAVVALTHVIGLLIGEGLVDKLVHAYTADLYPKFGYCCAKAKKNNKYPWLEEYSHFGLSMALLAGSMGIPCMLTRTMGGADFMKHHDKIKLTSCPFTEEPLAAVKAINPDVGIVHVQQADAEGYAHRFGTRGMDQYGLLASNKIIVTTERIVSSDVIRRDPGRTLVPGFVVAAVVEEPWGAYPLHLSGEYNGETINYFQAVGTAEAYEAFVQNFIYGVSGRREYLEKVKAQRGEEYFEKLRIQNPVWSEPIKSGY